MAIQEVVSAASSRMTADNCLKKEEIISNFCFEIPIDLASRQILYLAWGVWTWPSRQATIIQRIRHGSLSRASASAALYLISVPTAIQGSVYSYRGCFPSLILCYKD
jgi:hypothetical protein